MNILFDNHDSRIKYYELMLERDLDGLPRFPLPEGYRFVFYRPGDCGNWIEIEKSAKEFSSYEQGMEAWGKYYAANEDILPQRMVFIENADGRMVATATAYYMDDQMRHFEKELPSEGFVVSSENMNKQLLEEFSDTYEFEEVFLTEKRSCDLRARIYMYKFKKK